MLPVELRDILAPDFHQLNFSVENFIKNELKVKLDKGTALIRFWEIYS
jgi:hypothetical protein